MSRSWSFKCGNQFLQWGSTHLKICSFRMLGSLRYCVLCSVMSFVHCRRALLQASRYLRSHLSTSPTAKAMGHFELVAISTFATIMKDHAYMETHSLSIPSASANSSFACWIARHIAALPFACTLSRAAASYRTGWFRHSYEKAIMTLSVSCRWNTTDMNTMNVKNRLCVWSNEMLCNL